jgi:hypothetical protein
MKKPVREMTLSEMWAVFFGHANEAKHRELLREMIDDSTPSRRTPQNTG